VFFKPISWALVFFYVLNATISMSSKLKEKSRISSNLEDLIDDDSIVTLKLPLLAFKIKREVLGV